MGTPEDVAAEKYFTPPAMNWQETVMSHGGILEAYINCHITDSQNIYRQRRKAIADAQAQATWQARQPEVDEAEQRGIRKVKEWVRNNHLRLVSKNLTEGRTVHQLLIDREGWQAFLKEVEK